MQNFNLATLIDVAKMSRTSVKEVMAALSGQKVAPETHQRILDAIAASGSVTIPSSMTQPEVRSIGVIVPGILIDDYMGNVVTGITRTAQEFGYDLTIHTREFDTPTEAIENYFRFLFATHHASDAFIVVVPYPYNDLLVDITRAFERPCILLDAEPAEGQPTVALDNYRSMRLVMDHLLALGHKQIAFMTGRLHMTSARERLRGYQDALQAAGLPVSDKLITEGTWTIESGVEQTPRLLEASPTTIVASNDLMAFGVIDVLKQRGIKIPQQISVTGFDDIPMAATITPSLTTVRQPMQDMGRSAVLLADALIKGQDVPLHSPFMGELVLRHSTAAPHN